MTLSKTTYFSVEECSAQLIKCTWAWPLAFFLKIFFFLKIKIKMLRNVGFMKATNPHCFLQTFWYLAVVWYCMKFSGLSLPPPKISEKNPSHQLLGSFSCVTFIWLPSRQRTQSFYFLYSLSTEILNDHPRQDGERKPYLVIAPYRRCLGGIYSC